MSFDAGRNRQGSSGVRPPVRPRVQLRVALLGALAASVAAYAGDAGDYGPLPPIGSSNVSIADPLVARPATMPCEVVLFDDFVFDDFDSHDFAYAPPADCPGPWQKIVLSYDLSVTAGRQYDRTGTLWIGGVNVYFGTTAEPTSTLAPSWHVERDLTDYSALLATTQPGRALLGNVVNATYTGVIHGSAKLEFYPADAAAAPRVPDRVIALGSDPLGNVVDLATPDATLAATLALPTNVEGAWLDVVAQAQASDEFWWTCLPDDAAAVTDDCPGTAFRETEVTIDGQPAGVAPVQPWVYTGAFQPLLWIPIPGVQTLNFKPYRVDLTPFAGVLSDGEPHTIALAVFNAHDHFSTTATLLLQLDAGSTQVTGAVTRNTIGAGPAPVTGGGVDADGFGTVTVDSNRQFTLAGYVDTSHGRVETTIEQTFAFHAATTYASQSASVIDWSIVHDTRVDGTTTTVGDGSTRVVRESQHYPFGLVLPFTTAGAIVSADFDLGYQRDLATTVDGVAGFGSHADNHVTTHHVSAAANRNSMQDYEYADTTGACYHRRIASAANKLASVEDGAPCTVLDRIFGDGFDGDPAGRR